MEPSVARYRGVAAEVHLRRAGFCGAVVGALLLAACARGPRAVRLPEGGTFWAPIGKAAASTQVAAGFRAYWAHGCVVCHGPGGRGGVQNPNAASGGLIPGLLYVKEGYAEEDLRRLLEDGFPEIGKADPEGPMPPFRMPGWKDRMPEAEAKALVAYLVSLYPAPGSEVGW